AVLDQRLALRRRGLLEGDAVGLHAELGRDVAGHLDIEAAVGAVGVALTQTRLVELDADGQLAFLGMVESGLIVSATAARGGGGGQGQGDGPDSETERTVDPHRFPSSL